MGSETVRVQAAPIWLIGVLFTIGYCHCGFWKGVLAIFLWPYLLGLALR